MDVRGLKDCYDIFGYKPELSVKGMKSFHTLVSYFASTIFYIIFIRLIVIQIMKIKDEAGSAIYESNDTFMPLLQNDLQNISFWDQGVVVAFHLSKPLDPAIGEVNFIYKTFTGPQDQREERSEKLVTEACTFSHFHPDLEDQLSYMKVNESFVCIAKDQKFDLNGKLTSEVFTYLQLEISSCINSSSSNVTCITDQEEIRNFYADFSFLALFQYIMFNQSDPRNPIYHRIEDRHLMIDPTKEQTFEILLTRAESISQSNTYPLCSKLSPFDICTDEIKQNFIDCGSYNQLEKNRNEGDSFLKMTMQLSDFGMQIKLKSFNVYDFLSSIGGFSTSLQNIMLFFVSFYNRSMFISDYLVNNKYYKKRKARKNQNQVGNDPERQGGNNNNNNGHQKGQSLLRSQTLFKRLRCRDLGCMGCCNQKINYYQEVMQECDIVKLFKVLLLVRQVKKSLKDHPQLQRHKILSRILEGNPKKEQCYQKEKVIVEELVKTADIQKFDQDNQRPQAKQENVQEIFNRINVQDKNLQQDLQIVEQPLVQNQQIQERNQQQIEGDLGSSYNSSKFKSAQSYVESGKYKDLQVPAIKRPYEIQVGNDRKFTDDQEIAPDLRFCPVELGPNDVVRQEQDIIDWNYEERKSQKPDDSW